MSRPHAAPDVFRAIADPTRRRLLDLLRGGERTVTDLAQPFHMTTAAISQHLSVLRHARLVTQRRSGTRRLYCLDASKLREAYSWLTRYQSQ
jgi:DNA-binding transcriptional ArsR family regulator